MTTAVPRADAMVLFGITGDLAGKMLLPALYQLSRKGRLTGPVYGAGRSDWSGERLRAHARACVAAAGTVDEDAFAAFAGLLHYARVDYDDAATFDALAARTRGLGYLAHYVAVPPSAYAVIARRLARAGLADDARLVVEKPFGSDLASARTLQTELTRYFPEERLRRVDHFLGKDVVEGLPTWRCANTLMQAVLDRRHVRGVQLTLAEDFGVADRGGFYDATGCVRDVVQNHLLQTLASFVMEPPRGTSAADSLDERVRALRAIRTVRPQECVRGQYAGYQDTEGVRAGSTTETYATLRTGVDTERWDGVPFTIRSGKALPVTSTEIVVELRAPAPAGYRAAADGAPNLVRLRLNPRSGASFDLLAQHADEPYRLDRIRAATDFPHLTGGDPAAYEHVLDDTMTGDPRRFCSMGMTEECWRVVGDVLDPPDTPLGYTPGTWGPAAAERLTTGRWFPLEGG
ncbi:glucose-6-phosphate dehydrogenase [Streptomyces sp. NPDC051940]|uniref:glucose-6-phosphate dehydrogenase n=1 Tax=Streptomyces sp. NPDC051940 TaxID=3155675 RepID=UPI00342C33AD